MTTKVNIKNYQSIKDVSFEVDGFTVIVGKNNIGKSAVIRALEAPLANQTGKNFIRRGEKKTTVKIERDDINIEWVKGASATYTISNGKEKKVFSKLNRDVPQPLIDAGFGKMVVGDKKVFPFIASQFDELFLVDKPGSVVTEVLASLYNIDILSKADDLCQKAIKSKKTTLKTREADLQTVQENLKTFVDFEKIKETVATLVEKEKETENLRSEILIIEEYEEDIKRLTKSLSFLRAITLIEIPDSSVCGEIIDDLRWLREKEEKFKELTGTVEKLKGISKLKIPKTKEIETLVGEVKELRSLDDTVTIIIKEMKAQKEFLDHFDISEINAIADKTESVLKEFNEIKVLEESFSETASKTKFIRDELRAVTDSLEKKEKEKAEIKVCPLCERPL